MRDRVRTGVCALALAAATTATACQPTTTADPSAGTSSGDGTKVITAAATLRLTAARAASVDTYSADLNEDGTGDGGNTKVTASFKFRRHPGTAVSADFSQLGSGDSNGGDAHAVLEGGFLYLNVPVLSPMLAGGKPWLRVDLTGLQKLTGLDAAAVVGSLLENGPATLSEMFTASTDLSTSGHDTVNGVTTTHLHGSVTFQAALQRLDSTEQDRLRHLYKSAGSITFDLWTDSSHLPRKASFKVEGSNTPTSTTVVFHYGGQVHISAPPADQVGSLFSVS